LSRVIGRFVKVSLNLTDVAVVHELVVGVPLSFPLNLVLNMCDLLNGLLKLITMSAIILISW
jgi:hypothetical protein